MAPQLPAGRDEECCSSFGEANGAARVGAPLPPPSHETAAADEFIDLDLLLRIISWTLDLRNMSILNPLCSLRTTTSPS